MALTKLNNQSIAALTDFNLNHDDMPSGSVLQIVQSSNDTPTALAATSWLTAATVTITPKFATSKIYVVGKVSVSGQSGGYDASIRLLRGSTPIGGNLDPSDLTLGSNIMASVGYFGGESGESMNFDHLDSPATTSPITYNLQVIGGEGVTTYAINRAYSTRNTSHWANTGDSTLTVMEIAG